MNRMELQCFIPFHTFHFIRVSFLLVFSQYRKTAGAAPPKNQATAKRGVLYMPQQPCGFSTVFFALPRGVPVSNCFNGLLRALTKISLEDRMSKFHLVKKWWDFENRDFGV